MSEKRYAVDNPTNLDLHKEQARQGAILESLSGDVSEIKHYLTDPEKGLVVEVDRLKVSSVRQRAAHWLLLTTVVGTAGAIFTAWLT